MTRSAHHCFLPLAGRALFSLAAALLFLGLAAEVRAEHCHPPAPLAPLAPSALGIRLGLSAEAATYATARYEGEYQGASFNASWDHRWLRLRAALPAYRIVRNGLPEEGLGDVLLDVRVPFARTGSDTLVGGAAIAATLPTGDPDRDLGMGHVMLMPGFWLAWQAQGAFLQAQIAYGRSLATATEHAHHGGGPMPIVNPMNASEVEASASAGYLLQEHLRVRGGIYGAIPLFTEVGASRGALVFGGDLLFGPVDLGVEGHLPIVGDPFLAKATITAGVRF